MRGVVRLAPENKRWSLRSGRKMASCRCAAGVVPAGQTALSGRWAPGHRRGPWPSPLAAGASSVILPPCAPPRRPPAGPRPPLRSCRPTRPWDGPACPLMGRSGPGGEGPGNWPRAYRPAPPGLRSHREARPPPPGSLASRPPPVRPRPGRRRVLYCLLAHLVNCVFYIQQSWFFRSFSWVLRNMPGSSACATMVYFGTMAVSPAGLSGRKKSGPAGGCTPTGPGPQAIGSLRTCRSYLILRACRRGPVPRPSRQMLAALGAHQRRVVHRPQPGRSARVRRSLASPQARSRAVGRLHRRPAGPQRSRLHLPRSRAQWVPLQAYPGPAIGRPAQEAAPPQAPPVEEAGPPPPRQECPQGHRRGQCLAGRGAPPHGGDRAPGRRLRRRLPRRNPGRARPHGRGPGRAPARAVPASGDPFDPAASRDPHYCTECLEGGAL